MSKNYYKKKDLLRSAILLPKDGITYSLSGETFLCKLGRHNKLHLPCVPSNLCTVICQRCGKILWQHELERFPSVETIGGHRTKATANYK